MAKVGYIKVFRTALDNPLYQASKDEPFDKWHAWEDLLLNANFKTTKRIYKGKPQITYPGQLQTSMAFLAEKWKWSRNKVDRFLGLLEGEGMITRTGTALGTTITIENWRKFQVEEVTYDTSSGLGYEATDGAAHGATDGTHKKKEKKVKKDNNPLNPPEGGLAGEFSKTLNSVYEEIIGYARQSDGGDCSST